MYVVHTSYYEEICERKALVMSGRDDDDDDDDDDVSLPCKTSAGTEQDDLTKKVEE